MADEETPEGVPVYNPDGSPNLPTKEETDPLLDGAVTFIGENLKHRVGRMFLVVEMGNGWNIRTNVPPRGHERLFEELYQNFVVDKITGRYQTGVVEKFTKQ